MVLLAATALLSLLAPSLAASCNATALRSEIIARCKDATSGQPCPAPCVASLAVSCPESEQSQELIATRNDFAFCKSAKPTLSGKAGKGKVAASGRSICYLKLTEQSCLSGCQWCGRECQPAKGKCRVSSPTNSSSTASTSPLAPPAAAAPCKDDAEGYLSSRGFDCSMLMQVSSDNCDFDLSVLSPEIPKNITPGQLCPATCKRCDSQRSTVSNATATVKTTEKNASNCRDDASGTVAKAGFTCAAVLAATGNNCQQNLHSLVASVPEGVTPATVCPASCGLCGDGNATKPKPSSQTFINGRPVGPAGKTVLEGLGLSLPAGRFYIKADGSAGPEGGPAVANVYSAIGSKIDQGVTRGFNEVQSSAGQTGQQIKTQFDQLGAQMNQFFGGPVKSEFDQAGGHIKTGLTQFGDTLQREFAKIG